MRVLVALLLVLGACAGPTQKQLAETPTAKTKPRPAVAPAASTSDKDREQATQSMDDAAALQRAQEEAGKAPPK